MPSPDINGPAIAGLRQDRLLDILACPNCASPLALEGAIRAHDTVVDAELVCATCGTVGRVQDRRPSFPRDVDGPPVPPGIVAEAVDLGPVERTGEWTAIGHGLLGDGVGASMRGTVHGVGVLFDLGTHAWSGRAELRCGAEVRTEDLYSAEAGSRAVVFAGLPEGTWEWSIEIVGGRSPASHGDQAIVREVGALVPADQARPRPFEPVNRGNPYPERFDGLVAAQALDALVLDVGGGDRVHADSRVLNFEYLPYKGPDFYGDGLHLPIASDSVDLILSQAVLEHVNDPQAAVDELWRILRPGGVVYVEIAFTQPLHAVPFHYFNVTPHGRDHLFRAFEILDRGSFGGLAITLEWFLRLVDARERLGDAAVDDVLSTLSRLDATLGPTELDQFASGVWVEARKPLRQGA